ncbi:MAG: hypothetical protein FJ054_06190 [Cyanobacteria bacterium M_surface_10_m2_119]|nr:hypothetical protein [Cyanobacteria bacterium M_surface_10_m2_119]
MVEPEPLSTRGYTRADVERLRKRHRGYQLTLAVEVLLVLCLPLAELWPGLLSLLLVALAVVLNVFLSRYSLLRRSRMVVYGFGGLAIALEVLWHLLRQIDSRWAVLLTVPHVVVWVVFLALVLLRKVNGLVREPFVTVSVLMGAASGYLLIGIAGGLLFTALWVFQPQAFNLADLPAAGSDAARGLMTIAPALMAGAMNLLTTAGTALLNPRNVTAQVISSMITVAGQLYVAILIAVILGRFHRRLR